MSMTREPNNLSSPPSQPSHRFPAPSSMQLPSMSSLLGQESYTRAEQTHRYPPPPSLPPLREPANPHRFSDIDTTARQPYPPSRPSEHTAQSYRAGTPSSVNTQAPQISVDPIQYEGPPAQRKPSKKAPRRANLLTRDQIQVNRSSMPLDGRNDESARGIQSSNGESSPINPSYQTSESSTSPGVSTQESLQPSVLISNLIGATSELQQVSTKYTLVIRQQPQSARACGYGERDRRVVDPPPILTLEVEDPHNRPETYVVHCVLWNVDTNTDASAMPESNERKQQRRLMGTNVASPFHAKDENNEEKIFFTFPDVSVRTPGTYRLKFNLCVMDLMRQGPGSRNPVPSTVMSAPFQVFNAKDFGGMQASSALTKSLKAQGCLIPVKKGNSRPKNRAGEEDEDDEDEDIEEGDIEMTDASRAGKRTKR